ncbi:hypothetical protein BAUCODRAFT_135458, partial [Baudoinia panamericana UAMH 10762]
MDETQPLLADARKPADKSKQSGSPGTSIFAFLNDHDPNPQDWCTSYKWFIVGLLAFMAFTTTFTCISVVPFASDIVADLDGRTGGHSTSTASVLLVTIWELGEAAGPLVIAPLSETYGRYPVFNVANALFILSTALGALSNSTALLIFARFLTGVSVASNVLNPAIIGDMFPPERRGSAMSMVLLAPLVGGAIGPAIAGSIAQTLGWRSVLWMSLALALAVEVLFGCFLRETYSTPLPPGLVPEYIAETPDCADEEEIKKAAVPDVRANHEIWTAIARPARMLFGSFVLQAMSLYGAVVFAFFYVMSTTLPGILRDQYNLPPAIVGTSFLAFSVGSALGIAVCNTLLDRIYSSLNAKRTDSKPLPEARLPLA